MAKEDKRFILSETVVEGGKKTKIGSFDTYEETCNVVEKLSKTRIPFCSINDKGFYYDK
jgi:hypothetical protein